MAWTIATSSGTTTITPDGTSDADLSVLLDSAISAGQSGISKPTNHTYRIINTLNIGADPGSVNWLYCSGLNLEIEDRLEFLDGCRVKITDRKSTGETVGPFTYTLVANGNDGSNNFSLSGSLLVENSTSRVEANRWVFSFRDTNLAGLVLNRGRVIYGGYEITNQGQNSTYTNCIFESDDNGVTGSFSGTFYVNAGVHSNCIFRGFCDFEITTTALFINNTLENIGVFYSSAFTASYLELISTDVFCTQNGKRGYLCDCNIPTLSRSIGGVSGGTIDLINSLSFLGSTNEAGGLLVARLSSNTQVYKRTFSGSGQVSGGNTKGETDGNSASSERLRITVATYTGPGYSPDYRGTWEGIFVKYGRLPQTFSFDLQGTLATKQSTPFGSLVDSYITVSNSATVAGYTQFTIDHTSSTVSISGSNTQRQFHDYSALEKASFADSGVTTGGNAVPKCCLPNLSTRIYERSTGLCLYNLVIADSSSVPTGSDVIVMAPGKNITLSTGGDYSTTPITTSSTSTITVTDDSDLRTWTGNGATISAASGPNKLVTVGNLSDWVQGSNVTLQAPQASVLAANFAGGVRVQVSHRQIFTIPSTAINTTTDVITLGSDSNGDVANFRTTSPNTLIRFTLATGATIPTSSPQIFDGGLYYWKSGGQLSITEGGAAINFSTQGSGNFILIAETEKDNSVVVGGSGYSYALTASNNALIRVKARYWQNLSGCTASEFFDSIYGWSSTAGVSIPDTINASALPDTIHNQIINITTIQLPVSGAQTPTNDGSTVSGLSFALEGTGKIQINANDSDGILLTQDIYAWGVYITSTAAGIRLASSDTFTASDLFNYTIKNLEFDNTGTIPLRIIGGRLTSSDGSTPIASSTSASIFPNVELIGTGAVVTAGGSALTTTEHNWLSDLNATLASSGVFSSGALANTKTAIGLASANLDTQLAGLFNGVAAIPTTTAPTVSQIWTSFTSGTVAPNLITQFQSGLSTYSGGDTPGTGTLLTRLSSARTGYLDNLSGGAPLLATSYIAPDNSSIASIKTKTDQLAFTSGNINANVLAGSVSVSSISADAITASSLATDAIAEIQSGLATASSVAAIPVNPLLASSYTPPNNSDITGILDKVTELHKRQGLVAGVSATVKDPEVGLLGYLNTSDSSVNQTLTKNGDGSVTISRNS